MAKQQKLNFISLLDQLVVIKNKAKEQNLNVTQLKGLRFVRKDPFGKVDYVDNFKLKLAKNGDEVVIIMLTE